MLKERVDAEAKAAKHAQQLLEERQKLHTRERDLLTSAFYNVGLSLQQQIITSSSVGGKVWHARSPLAVAPPSGVV